MGFTDLDAAFHHLRSADLFKEFRTGDVRSERWVTPFSLETILATAAQMEEMGERGDLGTARETLGALGDEVARLSRELAARLEG